MSDAKAWHDRWRDGRIGFHADHINPYLEAFWSTLSISSEASVFVPLCGKTLDLHWLAARQRHVIGVELSAIAIADFFTEADLLPERTVRGPLTFWTANNLTLIEGDFFALESVHLDQATSFFDRAALIALPVEIRKRYMAHLANLMPPDSIGLTVTLDYGGGAMTGPPFAVPDAEFSSLSQSRFDINPLQRKDVLANEGKFRDRGVTHMTETAWRLQRS
ncbi:MAG: thiopurine S-methyltransferase [Pseudomonadota bacterium]